MEAGKKILLTTVGIVAALVVGRIAIGLINQPDDKTLIMKALKEAQVASKEGKPGGVLDFLSSDLTVNQSEAAGAKRNIADYIKKMKPDVEFQDSEPQILGESARLDTAAKVTIGILTMTKSFDLPSTVIRFEKEESREWLIIPKKTWKIKSIEVPMESLTNLPELPSGIPGF